MNDPKKTYQLQFLGGGPGLNLPPSGVFDTEDAVLNRIAEVNDSDFGPLAEGDAKIVVYEGDSVDPTEGAVPVIGEIDASVAHTQGGFEIGDLKEYGSL